MILRSPCLPGTKLYQIPAKPGLILRRLAFVPGRYAMRGFPDRPIVHAHFQIKPEFFPRCCLVVTYPAVNKAVRNITERQFIANTRFRLPQFWSVYQLYEFL